MPDIGRRSLLKTATVAAGGLALGGATFSSTAAAAPAHDHGDHIGDYFEMLKALSGAGLNVRGPGRAT